MLRHRGLMFVLSSPSGAGKTTITRALLANDSHLKMSVSVTTRSKRAGEEHGKDYFFVSAAEYAKMLREDAFLEHAQVFDNAYGTPRAFVEGMLSKGEDVVFDIDWQGTRQLKAASPYDVVSVFILPPSYAVLKERLYNRAQDDDHIIARRMAGARAEMQHYKEYDYVVVNKDLEKSIAQVYSILKAERLKRGRQLFLEEFVSELCDEGREEETKATTAKS